MFHVEHRNRDNRGTGKPGLGERRRVVRSERSAVPLQRFVHGLLGKRRTHMAIHR